MRIINECSFLLRGAVTIGNAIVKEDAKFIVGPAYLQAYQLQENDAIYPRIIVDKSVTKEIKKLSPMESEIFICSQCYPKCHKRCCCKRKRFFL
jgi:hypothetical protein